MTPGYLVAHPIAVNLSEIDSRDPAIGGKATFPVPLVILAPRGLSLCDMTHAEPEASCRWN